MTKHKQTQKIAFASTAVALGLAGIVGMTVPTYAEGSEVKIDVNVKDALSLAVYPHGDHTTEANQLSLGDAMPGGELVTNSIDAVVRSNVTTGYQLSLRDSDNEAGLTNAEEDVTIPTLISDTLSTEFPAGYYGYSIDTKNQVFSGVPTTSDSPAIIRKIDSLAPSDGDVTTVTFGAKLASNTKTGEYNTTVVFTASPELVPEVLGSVEEWTTNLYWDTQDLGTYYNWVDATKACAELGKRLPSTQEYRDLLTAQGVTMGTTEGDVKMHNPPYNFVISSSTSYHWTSDVTIGEKTQADVLAMGHGIAIETLGIDTTAKVRCVSDK